MCWSGEASAAIAVGGLTSAYYLKKKGEPKEIYYPVAYFVLMEGLQAATYMVVGACGNTYNLLFTRLAVAHICFQPFFINMLGMAFIDKEVKNKIKNYVYLFCGIVAVLCLFRLLPLYDQFGNCKLGSPLCSHTETCAFRGEWHIGWNVMLNGFNEGFIWYIIASFVLPVIYGSWKWVGYHYLVGPFLASLTTVNVNERPAVWCLFSTMIIALLVNTKLRQYIYVKKWLPWNYLNYSNKTVTDTN